MERKKEERGAMAYLILAVMSLGLTVTGVVLKLTGAVTFSWWWITAPLWGFALGTLLLLGVLALSVMILSATFKTGEDGEA